jgi:Flp pilus assembly protein TadG
MRPQTGAALVEFTIVFPVLIFLILGLAQFGLIFYNYILLTNAVATGARELSISRWDTTPYTDTLSAIENAAGSLNLAACLSATPACTITLSVDGSACSNDTGCSTTLQKAPLPSSTATPWPSSVTVQYQCTNNSILPASLINLAGICPMTSTMQQPVQ